MRTKIEGITIDPAVNDTETPRASEPTSLSLRDMNRSPATRTNGTQTLNTLTNQQGTQSTPMVINKATDSNDLIRLAHKTSNTELCQKRDQMVHTADLIRVTQTGTNTPQKVILTSRSIASNTNAITVKSIGVNCETQVELNGSALAHSSSASKIPRPSPTPQRKFQRQETFTVSKIPTLDKAPDTLKCPAEMMLK